MVFIVLLQAFIYGMSVLEYAVPTGIVEVLNFYGSEIKAPELDFFWYITQDFEFIHSLHYIEILILWVSHGRTSTANRDRFVYNLFGSKGDRSGMETATTRQGGSGS